MHCLLDASNVTRAVFANFIILRRGREMAGTVGIIDLGHKLPMDSGVGHDEITMAWKVVPVVSAPARRTRRSSALTVSTASALPSSVRASRRLEIH